MKELYPHSRATRNILRNFHDRNIAERAEGNLDQIRRGIRTELQRSRPDLSNADIERLIERRVQHGMRPTLGAEPIPAKLEERCSRQPTTRKLKRRR